MRTPDRESKQARKKVGKVFVVSPSNDKEEVASRTEKNAIVNCII